MTRFARTRAREAPPVIVPALGRLARVAVISLTEGRNFKCPACGFTVAADKGSGARRAL